jgi:hypothetical protein
VDPRVDSVEWIATLAAELQDLPAHYQTSQQQGPLSSIPLLVGRGLLGRNHPFIFIENDVMKDVLP